MNTITIQRRDEQCSHPVTVAAAQSHRHDPVRTPAPRPRRWALVQVWDGALLATFDHETGARAAMACIDDDEVVLLCAGT
jgi:hypothetical protein